MKLNVCGTLVEVSKKDQKWIAYYLGNEGKKRIAHDIQVPATIDKDGLIDFIADSCHEWARQNHQIVFKID